MRRRGGTESGTNGLMTVQNGESLPVQQRKMDLRVAGRTQQQ
jgi:hypothetical protein